MKIFECPHCHSKEIFTEEVNSQTGLYCADCGKWIKWLNKDEARLAKRQESIQRETVVQRMAMALKEKENENI